MSLEQTVAKSAQLVPMIPKTSVFHVLWTPFQVLVLDLAKLSRHTVSEDGIECHDSCPAGQAPGRVERMQ